MTWRHDGVLKPGTRRVGPREALQLHRGGGVLRVLAGSVWVTRSGDAADYLVLSGERFPVTAGQRAVIEAVRPGEPTFVHWEPAGHPLLRRVATVLGYGAGARHTSVSHLPRL